MSFALIPVLDLQGGVVVHARRGERAHYRPIESSLCGGCDPVGIMAALLDLHPFAQAYIADLDAIGRRGDNVAAIGAIRRRFPELALWVDAGIGDAVGLDAWARRGLGQAVIGSEALDDAALLAMLAARPDEPVLSLDFRGDAFVGPPAVLADASYWPRRLIAMTLARVGAGLGPDWARLAELMARAQGRQVFAAGGVRDAADLERLAAGGVAGVLVASALHDGRLRHADLSRFAASGPA